MAHGEKEGWMALLGDVHHDFTAMTAKMRERERDRREDGKE